MDTQVQARIQAWLNSPYYDVESKAEVQALIDQGNTEELNDRFYKDLEFGTGGLRGIRGAGTNRMNIYNVRAITQGLANYILASGDPKKGVVIGRDCRIQSDVYAQATAEVLAANGILVLFYADIHPTPTLSFAIRTLDAQAGVMVTASHNPKEYNGYKVFWEDGAQVNTPVDQHILKEVHQITDLSMVQRVPFTQINPSLIRVIDEEIDPQFIASTERIAIHPGIAKKVPLRVVYSPLHGTGYRYVPMALDHYGFSDLHVVEEQAYPDGNFPAAPSPNPGNAKGMALAIETGKRVSADIVLASDPDADRVGVAVPDLDKNFVMLSGNQVASLLTYYILSQKKATGTLPTKPLVVSTIVTTDLLSHITKDFGGEYRSVLTGFKWIARETVHGEADGLTYVFGTEESVGYNANRDIRDKDAVGSCCLIAEMVAFYKSEGRNLLEVLDSLYEEYGFFLEEQLSFELAGASGLQKIQDIMQHLRSNIPPQVGSFTVTECMDVQKGEVRDMTTGNTRNPIGLPPSNVIILRFGNHMKVAIRPSGTEPLIKFYFSLADQTKGDVDATKARLQQTYLQFKAELLSYLGLVETV